MLGLALRVTFSGIGVPLMFALCDHTGPVELVLNLIMGVLSSQMALSRVGMHQLHDSVNLGPWNDITGCMMHHGRCSDHTVAAF